MKLKVLCIGDIVGRPGRRVLADKLHSIIKQYEIDCVIANAENAAGGSGLTPQIYDKIQKYGVNLMTLGDHAYRKKDIVEILETAENIARPANLSPHAAGKDFAIYKTSKGPAVAAVPLIGRIFMKPAECPFNKIDSVLERLRNKADIVFVDFHGEATSEKLAMAYYLDGKVSCVFGTHTHVTTADEKILPKGTAYITDLGMTGPHDSILGRKIESVVKSMRTQMPMPFEVANSDVRLNGIIVGVDSGTKQAERIERICVLHEYKDTVVYDTDDGKPEHFNSF